MPKIIETKVYEYVELSEEAKQKAIQWFLTDYPEYEWWDCTYEDAKTIGLKITSFDLERNRHAKGHFIKCAEFCANEIIKEHGESCETYKTAQAYLTELKALNDKYPEQAIDFEDEKELMDDEFLKSLLEDYSVILQNECEYLTSEEHAIECIELNEYTFTESGKRFG